MKTSSEDIEITPKLVRAARALLAWSQQDLAQKANVATSTVADFERGQRTPVANNAQAIRRALEDEGITFLPTGAFQGPSVPPVTIHDHSGLPIRWVSSEDVTAWADRVDSAATLPVLITNLIRATHGAVAHLSFPSDAGVRHPGWDGKTRVGTGSTYVPSGNAGWELSVQRADIAGKANDDYTKRTDAPDTLSPKDSTFVFVTARHWPGKDAWARDKTAEGKWQEVRAYDVVDIVHWIEQTPAVGAWFATYLNKRPIGVRELDDAWSEWSLATQWPMSEELVLSDRDEDSTAIFKWLRSVPSVMSIQANDTGEASAFFAATLSMLPDDIRTHYWARTLVVTADAARSLKSAAGPLILLLTEPDPGLARSIAEQGHFVLQLYDDRPVGQGTVHKLARPDPEQITAALEDMGIPEPRAKSLARDCNRNLAILRRLIPAAPGGKPDWAATPPPDALTAALLAGAWDSESEEDRAVLSQLADKPYADVEKDLLPYVGDFDAPLRKIGTTWHIASPHDAWLLLASYIHPERLKNFEMIAADIFGALDPRFDMNPEERWLAPIKGVRPKYSAMLRHGIGEVLILLALWGDEAKAVSGAKRIPGRVVEAIFKDADAHRWWSLSTDFRLLAEACPDAFLDAIDASLDRNAPPISSLFRTEDDPVYGAHHLSDLCWALESLAWSPGYMARVSHVLARLAAIDTTPSRYMNRPSNSLRDIHLLWNPQTTVPLDQRLKVIDALRSREPDVAWMLLLSILPGQHDVVTPSAQPRWRDFPSERSEDITWPLIGRGAREVAERLLKDAVGDLGRLSALLDRISDLPDLEAFLSLLQDQVGKIRDDEARAELRSKLRHILHNHREFADADWALDEVTVCHLDAIYQKFEPSDLAKRHAWLFALDSALPNPSKEGWEAEDRQRQQLRREAVKEVYSTQGAAGILKMATLVDTAGYIGGAIIEADFEPTAQADILAAALIETDPKIQNLAHGMIITAYHKFGSGWGKSWLDRALAEGWAKDIVLLILNAMSSVRETWTWAADLGNEIEDAYWKRVPRIWLKEMSVEDQRYAIEKLIAVGRARHAMHVAGHIDNNQLPSQFLVNLLHTAATQPFENTGDNNENVMFRHYVVRLLKVLDERSDLDLKTIPQLEWLYLPLLDHSERPAKALVQALSESPLLFKQMLTAMYNPDDDRVEPELPKDQQTRTNYALQAARLFDAWKRLPGTHDDGSIDAEVLRDWITQARNLAKAAGRADPGDYRIGVILSAVAEGDDGVWPAQPVRDALEQFRSHELLRGFIIGKINRRGVTTRLPSSGGQLERSEAATYRRWADALQYTHIHTAKALREIAERYDRHADRHDEDLERDRMMY